MLNILAGIIICLFMTTAIHADDGAQIGRASLVAFPHIQHQKNLGGCTDCHGAHTPGPIAQFGEKWAHTTCTGCHRENKAGPVECSGCHAQF